MEDAQRQIEPVTQPYDALAAFQPLAINRIGNRNVAAGDEAQCRSKLLLPKGDPMDEHRIDGKQPRQHAECDPRIEGVRVVLNPRNNRYRQNNNGWDPCPTGHNCGE